MTRIERILAHAAWEGVVTLKEATAIAAAVIYTSTKSDALLTQHYGTAVKHTLESLVEEVRNDS